MAATKNNNNTNTANTSSSDAGGFKTVAFGFDKNDVTLYIASLRKKMKAMEDEFEMKLAQALENPAVSNDALKHEREVIRAEMEKQWNDKIVERTSIIKNQQQQINELESQLAESNASVESLKAQLAAVTSASDSDAGSAASARAAEAYMQFTAELRSISSSAQRTLASIEQMWKGELGVSEYAQEDMAEIAAPVAPKPAPAAPKSVQTAEPAAKPVEDKKPVAASNDMGFGSLLADEEEEDPFAGLISDINGDEDEVKVPLKSEPEPEPAPAPAPKPEPAPKPAPAPAPAPKPAPKPAPVKADIPDEFASLLADDDMEATDVEEANTFDASPVDATKGDDLDADLLSDIVIAPGADNNSGDLGKMLQEKEESEFDAFKDLFVSESEPDEIAGDISDLSVTPIAEAEYKPGVSTEFDLTPDENAGMKGLENFLAGNDEAVSEVEIEAKPEPIDKNKEEDLFDFSFLAADDDDEDDMSSNVSDF